MFCRNGLQFLNNISAVSLKFTFFKYLTTEKYIKNFKNFSENFYFLGSYLSSKY